MLCALPAVLIGQADSTAGRPDTTLMAHPRHFAVPPLVLRPPAVLRAPRRALDVGARFDSALAFVLDSARTDRRTSLRYLTLYGVARPGEPEFEPGTPRITARNAFGLDHRYADLTIDGQAQLDIRTDRFRNERCGAAELFDPNSGCRGGFKAPRLENQFNIRSGGLIGRRLHVNVDYDTQRDFAANNNIQVYYQGLDDEVVRRVEIGSVTFRPPPSRFITSAIPATNFGVNATFEVGPVQIQALAATQKGSIVAERTYTVGQTTSQPQDRVIRDVDFESGRFFWVVDPLKLPGYPAIDILNVNPAVLPTTEQPQQIRVYRYRAATGRTGANPNLGGINAVARRRDGSGQQFGGDNTFWDLLIQGTDYYVDPSGLWITLTSKLDQNDYLAVSFTTVAGTRVGTFPALDTPTFTDTLELVVEPRRGADVPTFRYEMRQVYRVAGNDLDPSSLIVNLSLNRSEKPQGSSPTYLAALGVAVPTDPNVFDRYNRLFPRSRDAGADQVVRESFIVFPNLQPFGDPTRLQPQERSDTIYRTPLYLVQSPEGPPSRFQLRLRYNASGGSDRGTLSLNALQIREGTEKLTVGGRLLDKGIDYSIAYETGQVTFLNPALLFGSGGGQVTARFEERGIFAVAPTSIFGFSTRYALGDFGALNLLALYQRESSAFNRPQLGFEASANFVGGATTELHFKPAGLTRLLNGITNGKSTAESRLDLNAEYAFTKPDPNRSGVAYLEEFEADAGVPVTLRENLWEFGSRPDHSTGLESIGFPGGFDSTDAVQLTWQNLVPTPSGAVFEVRPQDIDPNLVFSGSTSSQANLETAMFLTLHADTAGGVVSNDNHSHWSLPVRPNRPRWRSMVTSLSTTGLDFTRNEFLEFWVYQTRARSADSAGVRVVFDLGSVNEDALAIAPDSFSVTGADTTYTGRQYVGVGRLDTERRSTGIFNADQDDNGILNDRPDALQEVGGGVVSNLPLCHRQLSSTVPLFPWGDLSARCTNGNGTLDTEDLNGDNTLNAGGPNDNVFRYIVELRDPKYFVRDGGTDSAGGKWRLFRVPIRAATDTIGVPNLRLIQHLRMTVAAPPDDGVRGDIVARFAIARMRFVGSPWARRTERPVVGLFGSTSEPHGEVLSSVISTENKSDTDLGYTSPPGVFNATARRDQTQDQQGIQINEKSLRVVVNDLHEGERGEAYLRFPAGPQNLLNYGQLRVWARGRGNGWEEGDLQAFIKLGSDNENFYLYRSAAHSTSWEPELVIDLEIWRRLRADIESRWLSGAPPSGAAGCPGTDSLAYVDCEGAYVVQVRDPGVNPPNLAAVQEISGGVYRVARKTTAQDAELWIDDIRLTRPVSQTGTALSFDTRLVASDVGDLSISLARQDGQFRQLGQLPTYRTTNALQLNTTWRLDRFLPKRLGLAIPVSVSYSRTSVDPQLVSGTDIRGDALVGLRRPQAWSASYIASIRRQDRSKNWFVHALLDPLSVNGSVTRGRAGTELSQAVDDHFNLSAIYNLQLARTGPRLRLQGILGHLPRWLRESEAGKALQDARISVVPTNVRLLSGLSRDASDFTGFLVPVTRASDALLAPNRALQQLFRNSAGVTWQPLGMLTLNGDLASTRDLRLYPDSTAIGRLAYDERRFFVGLPVGVERDRTLTTSLTLAPRLASWLRPRYIRSSSFVLSRTLNTRDPVRQDADTAGAFILPQTLNNQRLREIGASIDFVRGLRQLVGDSSGFARAFRRVRPIDISSRSGLQSTFDLSTFQPGLGYELGTGSLDEFLTRDGSPSRGVNQTRTTTIAGGADLPLGFTTTLNYTLQRSDRFQALGGAFVQTITRQVEWPVGSVRWSRPFRHGPLSLIGLGTSFRRREGTSLQPSNSGNALSITASSTFTPDLQIALRNGMSLSLTYSALNQRTGNNGNSTELVQDDFSGTFTYSFRMPASLGRSRKLVRSSITAFSSVSTSCLARIGAGDCVTISDLRRRELKGGLNTDVAKSLTGGLQIGYTLDDARHLDRRTSQIFLLASLQLSLYAGDYR